VFARKLEGAEAMQAVIEENVRLQLTHLRSHPAVAAALANDTINLLGWVYDIGDGKITVLDETDNTFIPLAEAIKREHKA
jgi:carbonic anhydrase